MYKQECVCVCVVCGYVAMCAGKGNCSGQRRNESSCQRVKQRMSGIKYAIGKLNVMAAFGRICHGRRHLPRPLFFLCLCLFLLQTHTHTCCMNVYDKLQTLDISAVCYLLMTVVAHFLYASPLTEMA